MIERGEIYVGRLDPIRGSEAGKSRPVVVVSHQALNRTVSRLGRGVVTIVPLTSNVDQVRDFQVLLPARECGLDRDSKAQAEQVRAVAIERLSRKPVGSLPLEYLRKLDNALILHLGLTGSR